ncbi:MAG: hypothetical protein KatS3mg107_0873 [Gemmataceae bacterium]|jgi:hypothetical protein|nr:MAG: hypothetical protein KatS3mg107_0873 [Gemmataceae bacterium]
MSRLTLGAAGGLLLSLLAVAWAEDPRPLTPAEAIRQIGQPGVVVEMVVKKAKNRLEQRGLIYLDSEEDFRDEKNLGVAISAEAAAKFRAQGIADPAAHFLGQTIRVRGCVMRFENRPYLPVHDPQQITLIPKKPR